MSVESANESVATAEIVDDTITVTRVATGTTTGRVNIIDEDNNVKKYKTFNITVEGAPPVQESVTFEEVNPAIYIPWGDTTETLNCTVVMNEGETINFVQTPREIADLSYSNGVITATRRENAVGNVTGTIQIKDGNTVKAYGNFAIRVDGEPSIEIITPELSISEGNNATALWKAYWTPVNSATYIGSSDNNVCTCGLMNMNPQTFNMECPINYVGPGTATVTVTIYKDNTQQEVLATGTIAVTST